MDPTRRGVYSYKFVEPSLKTLRGLGARLVFNNKEKFKDAYGNLEILDYQLAPTLEEYSHILGVEIKDQSHFVPTKELPKSQHLAEILHIGKNEVELNLKPKGVTHGFALKFLVDKAITFDEARSWDAFNTMFSLIIYGIVLFPNMEDFADLASIYLFMAKNLVPTLLVDTYYFIHVRNEKKKGTTVCCTPLLYKWFILHLPNNDPFVDNEGNLKWSERIMSLTAEDIFWYSRVYDGVEIIMDCSNFPNIPLIGTKDGINYNPRIALRQLGYSIVDKPDSELLEEFILSEGVDNSKFQKRIIRA
ncbi:uncharacterized protein LOC127103597 [Lathyrus oleraceus]|uniref:uncharacterized protein LOC127103597 n=1 Tax=Pisum sativum TaxID=3888 RepID=UPI0021CEFF03|nr:uncharacterized protein LOC127103597 [Pisum sativum]